MSSLDELISVLDRARPIVIQAHDFPDHDAVGSAYALSLLLENFSFSTALCYGGEIQSESLKAAIDHLSIPILSCTEVGIDETTQLIVVDGFAGNSNMIGLSGTIVGVIDHHIPPTEPDSPFSDIRVDYGACSTIIFEYFRDAGVELTKNAATGLLIGQMMDTAFMTRGVTHHDLDAFSALFFQGDWQAASRLLKNSLSLGDLAVFREAIEESIVARDFCYVPLANDCSTEVAALVADFFLNLMEIHFTVVVSSDRDEHRLSVRSEDPERPADVIIRGALEGIGSGGGHTHMGGGSIPRHLYPGHEGLRKRFLSALGWAENKDSETV